MNIEKPIPIYLGSDFSMDPEINEVRNIAYNRTAGIFINYD